MRKGSFVNRFFRKSEQSKADEARLAEFAATIASINRSQATIEFELDGTIITANENFLRTMGYGLAEIQGRHHSLFARADYVGSDDYIKFWRSLNDGQFMAGKFERLGKGGASVWLQATYNPLFDAAGNVYKVIKFATEITAAEHQRIKAEAERLARLIHALPENGLADIA